MIYQKRKINSTVKAEDLPSIPPVNRSVGFSERLCDDRMKFDKKAERERKANKKIRSMRKRRHRLKNLVVTAALIFIISILFDRGMAEGYFSFTDRGQSRDKADMTQPQNRTLYTMQYSATNTQKDPQTDDMTLQKQPSVLETDNEQKEILTDKGISSSNVDGVTYYPITKKDLSAESVFSLSNGTPFEPDVETLSQKTPNAVLDLAVDENPLVLIIHTHGTECYSEYVETYPENVPTRNTDTDKNVVRVGKEIAKTLADFGICAIHCETMHDEMSFINAYSESAKTVEEYLEKYPSIKFVIDVHRDAVIREDGESIKTVKNIAGQDYAQLMFVVGTNALGHDHPDWTENLSLALMLQQSIETTYPGLCRSINLRDVPFNQQLSQGYLLLEVGTCANTMEEALLSARAFSENLSRIIYGNV